MKYIPYMFAAVCCLHLGTAQAQHASPQTSPSKPVKFIDPANMDASVKPGDDFYTYANGNWVKNNPVPAKETRWGSFNVLRDDNAERVRALLEKASKEKAAQGSVSQRVGDFYASGMDSATIEKVGYNPIKTDIRRITALTSSADVLNEMAFQRVNAIGSPLFGAYVGQDRKNPDKYIVQIGQGGTSLPDRDYYLVNNARNEKIREAYKAYITTLFGLIGEKATAARAAETVIALETRLAKAQMSRIEMRDPYKTYNKFSVAAFAKTTPNINWQTLLPAMKMGGQDSLLVASPAFMTEVNTMVKSVPLEDWKMYLKWNVLKGAAPYLNTGFVNAQFAFNQVLSGQKVQTPRWQRVGALVDGSVGDLLGQLYVKEYFKPEAKERMLALVNNLQSVFSSRIKNLDWMSPATKEKAEAKLAAITKKIAYPDKWKAYDGVHISRGAFFSNVKSASRWAYNDMVNQLGKPVDRTRWGMTPPTVNAYYSPVNNEIAFPAGILQFPFFDFEADDAANYGGIGAVIGHEMTHGFDDSGRQYDADGTLRDWWTKTDADKFKTKADQVVKQYDGYTVLDTMHVRGKLTLGENLADLGGMAIAYEAFKNTPQGKTDTKIDGLSPDQRFFLSFAQVWRNNTLPETAAQLIITDPHSPGEYRAIGAAVNMDAWYKAFDVKPGDKLYKKPEDRIRVW
ncbi:MAG: M13 family metallopeptidase [Mucilaginibacter polytrichastri]|nr:M13 family metallopeptidase [Mucilaginibacter polytrichastri]